MAIDYTLTLRDDIELTPGMKEYMDKRVVKLDRYSHHINAVEIKLARQRERYIGEIIVDVKYELLKAEYENKDFYELVNGLIDAIKGQLKKYEEKLKRKK